MLDEVTAAIAAAGFTAMRGFNQVRPDSSVEFIIGCHSVGDWDRSLDDAVITARGVEWLSPPIQRIGLIR